MLLNSWEAEAAWRDQGRRMQELQGECFKRFNLCFMKGPCMQSGLQMPRKPRREGWKPTQTSPICWVSGRVCLQRAVLVAAGETVNPLHHSCRQATCLYLPEEWTYLLQRNAGESRETEGPDTRALARGPVKRQKTLMVHCPGKKG